MGPAEKMFWALAAFFAPPVQRFGLRAELKAMIEEGRLAEAYVRALRADRTLPPEEEPVMDEDELAARAAEGRPVPISRTRIIAPPTEWTEAIERALGFVRSVEPPLLPPEELRPVRAAPARPAPTPRPPPPDWRSQG